MLFEVLLRMSAVVIGPDVLGIEGQGAAEIVAGLGELVQVIVNQSTLVVGLGTRGHILNCATGLFQCRLEGLAGAGQSFGAKAAQFLVVRSVLVHPGDRLPLPAEGSVLLAALPMSHGQKEGVVCVLAAT